MDNQDKDFTDFSVGMEEGVIDINFAKTDASIDAGEIAAISIKAGARDMGNYNNDEASDVLDGYIEIVTKNCAFIYLPTDMIPRPIAEVNTVAKEIKSFWLQHKVGNGNT